MPIVRLPDGREIAYEIDIKKVKNINLRIRRDGTIYVSANQWTPTEKITRFVQQNAAAIQSGIDRMQRTSQVSHMPDVIKEGSIIVLLGYHVPIHPVKSTRNKAYVQKNQVVLECKDPTDQQLLSKLLDKLLDTLCRDLFESICKKEFTYFEQKGIPFPTLKIRDMKSRWGSCMKSKGIVTLNKQLIHAPMKSIEYVVMHEFCHLIHADHSRRFYALLEQLMPDYRIRKKALDGGADTKENNR